MHVLQISRDVALLQAASREDEPIARQLRYADILAEFEATSRVTILVLTASGTEPGADWNERLRIVPVRGAVRGRLALASAIRREHRRLAVDVITTQTVYDEAWIALAAGRLLRVPVVGQIHFDVFSPMAREDAIGTGPGARLRAALLFGCLKGFSAIRCVAESTAAKVRERVAPVPVRCIPVPVAMVRSPAAAEEPRARSVLYVGRLAEAKNLFRWLEAAAVVHQRAPDVTFDIVGDGPLRPALVRYASRLKLAARVHFHGTLGHDRLRSLYAKSSLLLMTSSHEGFGRVAVEAAAHATPTVATAVTGLDEIVEDGRSGFVVRSPDPEHLAAAALRVLSDPAERRTLGEAARTRVHQRYDPEQLAREWVAFLVSVCRRGPAWLLRPRARTFRRWRSIARSRLSLLRSLEYEAIRGLRLRGHTLDIGGGTKTGYVDLLRVDGRLTTVNLDAGIGPAVRADLDDGLPFRDGSFDNVISLNTFEHVWRDERALSEAVRVLKPGGSLHLLVPFMYQVHASPSDYTRRTCFWWQQALAALGIPEAGVTVEPLVWDRLASAYSLTGQGPLGVFLKRFVLLAGVIAGVADRGRERMPPGAAAASAVAVALGYYIRAIKQH